VTTVRPPPEALPCDDRPVGLHCWGCARHFVPKGTPKPFVDGFGQPAVRRSDWQWREFLCDLDDCLANVITKGLRR
jgi:hypothetical protein